MASFEFEKGIPNLVTKLEKVIENWSTILNQEVKEPAEIITLSHGDLFKLLLVESQEMLYLIQKTNLALDPKAVLVFKHSNALPPEVKNKPTN